MCSPLQSRDEAYMSGSTAIRNGHLKPQLADTAKATGCNRQCIVSEGDARFQGTYRDCLSCRQNLNSYDSWVVYHHWPSLAVSNHWPSLVVSHRRPPWVASSRCPSSLALRSDRFGGRLVVMSRWGNFASSGLRMTAH